MNKRVWNNQGFMLAEVILAIFIICVALIPISGMFIQAMNSNAMAREYTQAGNLAQKQLELLKLQPPAYWAGLSLPCTLPWQHGKELPADQYNFTTTATAFTPYLVQVTVSAVWQERGRDCSLKFVTLYPAL